MKLLFALLLAIAAAAAPAQPAPSPADYPACITDESGPEFPACYWNAAERGNRTGHSYIWTGSKVIYL